MEEVVLDDWTQALPESEGLSRTHLEDLEKKISSGEFKKITSILVARHGKLVYENYPADSDPNALTNTRSATKTVASVLAGIAIDKGLLSGVDAKVFSFFPDKQPVVYPDPAKTR